MNIAVVEDETLIRAGICKRLENLGYQVVFDTDSGYRMLDYLKNESVIQPDVLLADICMPIMDGLVLMEQVREILPELPIVVLSGYNNFEYARTAIRLGVQEYLLKPVNGDEMKSVMEKIEKELLKRRQQYHRREIQESMENLSDHICCRGSVPLSQNTLDCIGEAFPEGFMLRLVLLSNWESHMNWFGRGMGSEYSFIYPDRPNLLVSFQNENDKENLKRQLERIPFTAYYSCKIKDINQICHEIRQGIRCIKDSLVLEKQKVVEQGEEKKDSQRLKQWEEYYELHYELLLKELEENNLEEVKKQIRNIMQFPGIPQAKRNQAWLWIAWKICEKYGIHGGVEDTAWLQEYDRLDQFVDGVEEELLQLLEESEQLENLEQNKTVLEEILDYINKNYAQDITLKGTSEQFYINRSHLARIFKQKTGTTFNNYLTELRIEKACQLMAEGVTISRVAEMVGYDNSRYFSRVFCKVKGCIPSRYRDFETENEAQGDEMSG